MLRFGETKATKQKFYAAKKLIKICDVNVDNVVISKLIGTKLILSMSLDILVKL